MVLLRNTDQQ